MKTSPSCHFFFSPCDPNHLSYPLDALLRHPHTRVRLSGADFWTRRRRSGWTQEKKKSLLLPQRAEIVLMQTNPTHYVSSGSVTRRCRSGLMETSSAEVIAVSGLPVGTQARPRPNPATPFSTAGVEKSFFPAFAAEVPKRIVLKNFRKLRDQPGSALSARVGGWPLRWSTCCRCWRGGSGSITEACCPSSRRP